MIEKVLIAFAYAIRKKTIECVIAFIIFDTIFGVIRAIKERTFNSSVGINGAIRKISMLVAICGMVIFDCIVDVNLIGFIPETIRDYIGMDIVSLADFFSILFIAYEVISLLKNMVLCGLPVKKVWDTVRKFLSKYTSELPDTDEIDAMIDAEKEGE